MEEGMDLISFKGLTGLGPVALTEGQHPTVWSFVSIKWLVLFD